MKELIVSNNKFDFMGGIVTEFKVFQAIYFEDVAVIQKGHRDAIQGENNIHIPLGQSLYASFAGSDRVFPNHHTYFMKYGNDKNMGKMVIHLESGIEFLDDSYCSFNPFGCLSNFLSTNLVSPALNKEKTDYPKELLENLAPKKVHTSIYQANERINIITKVPNNSPGWTIGYIYTDHFVEEGEYIVLLHEQLDENNDYSTSMAGTNITLQFTDNKNIQIKEKFKSTIFLALIVQGKISLVYNSKLETPGTLSSAEEISSPQREQ